MEAGFEPGGAHLQVLELQIETCAGLGFGVTALLMVSWIAAVRARRKSGAAASQVPAGWLARLVRWAAVVSLLAYMAKTGLSTSGRLIAPYYCLLMPVLLCVRGQETVVRRCWWRGAAAIVFALAALLVVLNPGRPLWPAQSVLTPLAARRPASKLIARAALLYESYAGRWDALGAVRDRLPPDARRVGFIWFMGTSTMETSLWRPFGQRKVLHIQPEEPAASLRARGIRHVVVATDSPEARRGALRFQDWFEPWLRANGGKVLAQLEVRVMATRDLTQWYVVELRPP
jgi:hypothetical protein